MTNEIIVLKEETKKDQFGFSYFDEVDLEFKHYPLKTVSVICGKCGEKLIPCRFGKSARFKLLAKSNPFKIVMSNNFHVYSKCDLKTWLFVNQISDSGEQKKIWYLSISPKYDLKEVILKQLPKDLKFLKEAILACIDKFENDREYPVYMNEKSI